MQSATELVIERPERWAKQLASHIGHRAEVEGADGVYTVRFGFGATGSISTSETAVLLRVEADAQQELERAKDVLGSHLLRFAKLEDSVTLSWL